MIGGLAKTRSGATRRSRVNPQGSQRLRLLWLILTVLALVGSILLVLAGLTANRARAEGDPVPPSLRTDDLLLEPWRFANRIVLVEGDVACALGPQAFILRCRIPARGLLVVLSEGPVWWGTRLQPGQRVSVRGVLRPLARPELQALEEALQAPMRPSERLAICANHPYVLALTMPPR